DLPPLEPPAVGPELLDQLPVVRADVIGHGRHGSTVLAQLPAGQRAAVYLVGAVGQAEGTRLGPQVCEDEVLAHPRPARDVDRLVDDPLDGTRCRDLDRLDLGMRALVAHGVHEPRGLQDEQAQLLHAYPGLGDPLADHALLGQRGTERDPVQRAAAHQLDRASGHADQAHAVVDPAGAEPRLGDGEAVALAAEQVLGGYAHVTELDLGVPAVRPVVVPEDAQAPRDV